MKKPEEIVILSFTRAGNQLNRRIQEELSGYGHICEGYTTPRLAGTEGLRAPDEDTKTWIGRLWGKKSFLFIGAAGIAVRYIAPWIRDKYTDSAVLVMDEKGDYVIPLLSGHMGGAVKIAREIERSVKAEAVITTATDVREKFAVDVFAKNNQLEITDRSLVTRISAAVLEEEPVGFFSELPLLSPLPDGLWWCDSIEKLSDHTYGIVVASSHQTDGRMPDGLGNQKSRVCQDADGMTEKKDNILVLRHSGICGIVAGIGCRKGTTKEQIERAFHRLLKEQKLRPADVVKLASIDLKKEEPGILAFAKEYHIPFFTYPASRLNMVPGEMEGSDFVSKITGVDNVCERAARCCSLDGRLLLPKTVVDGITFALAEERKALTFTV